MLRRGKKEDRDRIYEIVQAGYRGFGGWTSEGHLLGGERILLSELDALTDESFVGLMVIEDTVTNNVVGCIKVERLNETECEFGLFSVDTAIQAKGFGSKLLKGAEEFAIQHFNATTGVIHVLEPRAELIGFYERRGYVKNGVRIPFPQGNERGEVLKVDELYFLEFKKPLV